MLFSTGHIDRRSSCRVSGSTVWRTVDDLLPLLKWGSPYASPPSLVGNCKMRGVDCAAEKKPAMTSALKAGWICLAIGVPFAWLLPPAHLLFTASLVLGIVAMATHQVGRGLALTLSSIFAAGVSTLISFLLAVGLFARAIEPVLTQVNHDLDQMNRQLRAANQVANKTPQQSLMTFNPSTSTPQPTTRMFPSTPVQTELLPEIARMESRQRQLRRQGRDLDSAGIEYLKKLRMEYDRVSVR